MKRSTKKKIALFVPLVVLFSAFWFCHIIGITPTFVRCGSNKIIAAVETKYRFTLPDKGIYKLKTAIAIVSGWDTKEKNVLIKFSSEPNVVEEFVRSLDLWGMELYPGDDNRDYYIFTPSWYTKPIKEGKVFYGKRSSGGLLWPVEVFVDISDSNRYVVYTKLRLTDEEIKLAEKSKPK